MEETLRNIPVADAHCDFLYYMYRRGHSFTEPRRDQAVSLPAMRAGGASLQLFAAWIDPDDREPPLQQCLSLIDAYKRMLACCDALVPFTKEFDPASGKIAALLTIEGGEAVMGKTENVRLFRELGARAMTLTWNAQNDLASPAMARRDRGLSALGREIVREMGRAGMALDVAHLSDRGIDDALDRTDGPVFSSHTNARAVFPHRRSISDRHIREIAARGGVVGVNYYSPQLVSAGRASITDVVAHISHIAKTGGPGCVVLGSDFDGMGAQSYPVGLSSWADVPRLLAALAQAGFSSEEVYNIAYGNLARFLKRFV
ncbi:MAG TPA: dipeptidase [Clostridia bacterium]|nr:dipeptidase [Clostridia bacterium]